MTIARDGSSKGKHIQFCGKRPWGGGISSRMRMFGIKCNNCGAANFLVDVHVFDLLCNQYPSAHAPNNEYFTRCQNLSLLEVDKITPAMA